MKEPNFCPYCDAPQHKLVLGKDDVFFCKSCNKFFKLIEKSYQCFKCGSKNFEDSEFPAPDGQIVLQCRKCKKMYSHAEFFDKTEEVEVN